MSEVTYIHSAFALIRIMTGYQLKPIPLSRNKAYTILGDPGADSRDQGRRLGLAKVCKASGRASPWVHFFDGLVPEPIQINPSF